MAYTKEQKEKLTQIEIAREYIRKALSNGTITEIDIIDLALETKDYGITKPKFKDYKETLLKQIYSCPFLLCDQEELSLTIKKLLPAFLEVRSKMELEELEYQYELGFINKEEYEKEKNTIIFCFYRTSKEGKQIHKNGHVKNVVDNVIRLYLAG